MYDYSIGLTSFNYNDSVHLMSLRIVNLFQTIVTMTKTSVQVYKILSDVIYNVMGVTI
jgi:hypothetical protein